MTAPRQLDLVYAAMSDGKWRTLWELADHINWQFGKRCAETAISARIRELPKAGVRYEKRERMIGATKLRNVWEYRVVKRELAAAEDQQMRAPSGLLNGA